MSKRKEAKRSLTAELINKLSQDKGTLSENSKTLTLVDKTAAPHWHGGRSLQIGVNCEVREILLERGGAGGGGRIAMDLSLVNIIITEQIVIAIVV